MNVGKLSFARFTVGECAHAVFNFFLYFFLCFFCFYIFFGLIVKQIFEEKGKFIFIFLQIP